MRLVFAGTPDPAVPALRALLASPRHDVVAVLTRPDAPAGRGRGLHLSPVKQLATEAGIEILQPQRPREETFLARLREIAPDCCPIVAYGALISQAGLDIPAHGWVNLHFSLLPAWRGAAPVQHAVLAGDDVTGATTFGLEVGMDTGPAYGMVTEPIAPTDTSGDLLARLADSGAALLLATLDGIEDGTLVPVPQPADGVSFAPKIEVADVRVDFTAPAMRVDRLIRAATPAPGAWASFAGARIKLAAVTLSDAARLPPGHLLKIKNTVLVGTSTQPVALGQVKPEGRGWMPAAAWANGLRLGGGERFDTASPDPAGLDTAGLDTASLDSGERFDTASQDG